MIAPGPGILLIAEPFLKDPNFIRTVVLLCEHQDQGSFGLVLNKQITQTLDELVPDLDGFPYPVFYGGPVQMNTLHFIHQCPDMIPGAVPVSKDIYWGGNFETVAALIRNNSIDPAKIKFFVGYSGWSNGQLAGEMEEKSWLTVAATCNLTFETPHADIWKESLRHLGGKYEELVNYPIDPQLN